MARGIFPVSTSHMFSWKNIDLDEGVAHVIIYFQNRHHITCSKKDQDQTYLMLTH
jgi:hypothetical protein